MNFESRKIVLILGNGFDLDLGLRTSYKDFWLSSFCPKTYPAPLIHHLNQRWGEGLEAVRWYDLENELLNYYRSIPDPHKGIQELSEEEIVFLNSFKPTPNFSLYNKQDLITLFGLINKGILFHNETQQFAIEDRYGYASDCRKSPIWRDHKALTMIRALLRDYLVSIFDSAHIQESAALSVLRAMTAASRDNVVDIYDFNYTPLPLEYKNTLYKNLHYVHGSCAKDDIIIGIGDDGELTKEYGFLRKAFTPEYNPPTLGFNLLNADDIIIFGHSLGENDRQYFKPFFKQQSDYSYDRGKNITIFTYDSDSEMDIKRALHRMTDNNLSALYGKNSLRIIKTSNLKDNPSILLSFLSDYYHNKSALDITMRKYRSSFK